MPNISKRFLNEIITWFLNQAKTCLDIPNCSLFVAIKTPIPREKLQSLKEALHWHCPPDLPRKHFSVQRLSLSGSPHSRRPTHRRPQAESRTLMLAVSPSIDGRTPCNGASTPSHSAHRRNVPAAVSQPQWRCPPCRGPGHPHGSSSTSHPPYDAGGCDTFGSPRENNKITKLGSAHRVTHLIVVFHESTKSYVYLLVNVPLRKLYPTRIHGQSLGNSR